jgi:predicted CXXCH cytochrome family protein
MFMGAVGICAALLLASAGMEMAAKSTNFGSMQVYSSGDLTHAHAMFGDNCTACHLDDPANPGKTTFNMPVRDEACISCHAAYAVAHAWKAKPGSAGNPDDVALKVTAFREYDGKVLSGGEHSRIEGYSGKVLLASRCAACHVEHQGRNHNLNRVSDAVCTQCHANLERDGYDPSGKPRACFMGEMMPEAKPEAKPEGAPAGEGAPK